MSKVAVQVKWNNTAINSMQNKAIQCLFRMGTDIAAQARQNAPYKTGALRDSIRVRKDRDAVEVIAGDKRVPYAAIQEWGGNAGRNHSTHIVGKHYMERAKDFIMSGNYLKKYFGVIV